MLYTCHPVNHLYKDQFDGSATHLSFNLSLSVFSVFPILLFFKDRFDSKCYNLGADLIENFNNLGTGLIDFIAGTEYYDMKG